MAGGVAHHLGVDPVIVRVAFVAIAVVTGVGVLVYLGAWWLIPAPAAPTPPRWARVLGDGRRSSRLLSMLAADDARTVVGVGCLCAGALLLLRDLGVLFSPGLIVPVALGSAGLALAWSRADDERRGRLVAAALGRPSGTRAGRVGPAVLGGRVLLGTALVVAGIATFLTAADAFASLGSAVAAVLVTVIGIGVLAGPWVFRLVQALRDERTERARSEERADIAAHLHDSVLQTLALIQRSAATRPAEAVALARRQERELRTWLYADAARTAAEPGTLTLVEAVTGAAEAVEADFGVEVEVVAVGDRVLDGPLPSLVAATREALVNAAKHAGVASFDCYIEVEPGCVRVYVRDRGDGFDPDAVPDDRRGLADSVVGRMARHGGTASVASAPGEGTEVTLEVPVP